MEGGARGVIANTLWAAPHAGLAILVSLALVAGCGGKDVSEITGSGKVQLRAVVWPSLQNLEIAQIEIDGARTWIRTLIPGPNGGNLFSLDATTLEVNEVPIRERLELIVAGEGQLWALADDGRRLLFLDETLSVRARALRAPCGLLSDPAGVVALGRLWLSCDGSVSAYGHRGGFEPISSPSAQHLLASRRGVWAITPGSLVGIGGAATGRKIPFGKEGEFRLWQSSDDEAWAVEIDSATTTLFRINLASGASTHFPLRIEPDEIAAYAISSNAIWVALRERPVLMRFDRDRPERPRDEIDLKDHAPSSDVQLFLCAGPSYVWVEAFSQGATKLFLVSA